MLAFDEIPDVDDRLGEGQVGVLLVRRGDDEQVALVHRLPERDEARIGDVRIGGEDAAGFERENFSQLLTERIAGVITLALERHAEDADPQLGQRVPVLQPGYQIQR